MSVDANGYLRCDVCAARGIPPEGIKQVTLYAMETREKGKKMYLCGPHYVAVANKIRETEKNNAKSSELHD